MENIVKQDKFSLSEQQVLRIHMQFKNFCLTRKTLKEIENKEQIRKKIMDEENKVCTHKP